ncbi:MAG: glycosyltransferase [Proteobacteria bacterium]|nr:glycosyltransferase [Pseudomonadota bacterium]
MNGEQFVRYNLRSLYPFAHEILIVEGAYWASSVVSTPDGHSIDRTLEELYRFKDEEDTRGIVQIITKNEHWDGLTQQCQAWAEKATGDYIWAVDIDEFYKPEDVQAVIDILAANPSITMISFKLIQFCFGFDYVLHSGRDFIKGGIMECRRIFKYGPDYRYIEHEPPTVVNPTGVDLKMIDYLDCEKTSHLGIYIYHYTAIFRSQVEGKVAAYALRGWENKSDHAPKFLNNWLHLDDPFHLGWERRYFTWLERFQAPHPPEISRLKDDVLSQRLVMPLRDNSDIEKLMDSHGYWLKSLLCSLWERLRVRLESNIRKFLLHVVHYVEKAKINGILF